MALDELPPGRFAALGSPVEAMLAQDVGDRGARDSVQAEFLELAVDARVTPAVFAGQAQNQVAEFFIGAGLPSFWPSGLVFELGAFVQRKKVRGETMLTSCQMALPRGLPKRSKRWRSFAVTRMRWGNLLRRMSFSTLRYWICWANSLSLEPLSSSKKDCQKFFMGVRVMGVEIEFPPRSFFTASKWPRQHGFKIMLGEAASARTKQNPDRFAPQTLFHNSGSIEPFARKGSLMRLFDSTLECCYDANGKPSRVEAVPTSAQPSIHQGSSSPATLWFSLMNMTCRYCWTPPARRWN